MTVRRFSLTFSDEPAWAANLEASLSWACSQHDYEYVPSDLLLLAKHTNQWLDSNRVSGKRENIRFAARLYRMIRCMADFEEIDINRTDDAGKLMWGDEVIAIHKATARLRKVLAARKGRSGTGACTP